MVGLQVDPPAADVVLCVAGREPRCAPLMGWTTRGPGIVLFRGGYR